MVTIEEINGQIERLSARRHRVVAEGGDTGNLTAKLRELFEIKRARIAKAEQTLRYPGLYALKMAMPRRKEQA